MFRFLLAVTFCHVVLVLCCAVFAAALAADFLIK